MEKEEKENIFDITNAINCSLNTYGKEAVEQYEGKLKGYRLQYVIDSVNCVLGPENWKYNLLEDTTPKHIEKGADETICLIELFIKVDNEWITKGQMFGSSNLEGANGLKAAIGDAVKKSFAYWGIGNKAYRGEL